MDFFKRKVIPITMTLLLGIGTLGIANAAVTVDYQQQVAQWIKNDPNPMPMSMNMDSGNMVVPAANDVIETTNATATTQTPTAPTTDLVDQMIQSCWQANQAMIDQWTNTTGLSRDDLLEMERGWMQGVMQQNPNLNTQKAVEMHQAWLNNKLANYKQANIQSNQQIQQQNVPQQPNWNQQVPPPAGPYNGWNCGWNNGYCW